MFLTENKLRTDFHNGDAPGITPSTWEIGIEFADCESIAWRQRLLDQARAALERKLAEQPDKQEFSVQTLLGTVHLRLSEGTYQPGSSLTLALAPALRTVKDSAPDSAFSQTLEIPSLLTLNLPDRATQRLAKRLVGQEALQQSVLRRWSCQWDDLLTVWSAQTGHSVPPALQTHFTETPSLYVFHGPPGVGKSVAARVIANAYCEQQGIPGTLIWLTTEVRGTGMVGEFSQRLRAAFQHIATLPGDTLRMLLIDEADAVAMHRREVQAHQEDHAATMTLLQCLDAMAGNRRLAVIMTTNRLSALDPAIQRRGIGMAFTRPDLGTRQRLLIPWLPGATAAQLTQAARSAHGMTPADIELALSQAWLEAMITTAPLTVAAACLHLRRAARTDNVQEGS